MCINKLLLLCEFPLLLFFGGGKFNPYKNFGLLIIHSSATLAAHILRFAASEGILCFVHQMHCELKIFTGSFVPDVIQLTYRAKRKKKKASAEGYRSSWRLESRQFPDGPRKFG